jgi:hypothetical protein
VYDTKAHNRTIIVRSFVRDVLLSTSTCGI